MTFCFFSAQYIPTVGGVERYTNSLAKELIKKGHKVVVVTSSVKGFPFTEKQDNISIYRVPSLFFANRRLPFALPLFKWHKIKNLLKSLKIDFIVVQTRLYPLCLMGAKFAKKNKIPFIIIDHSTTHLIPNGVVGYCCSVYEHILMQILKRYNAEFYGVSKACTQWLSHFNVNTDKVLYNAVDPVCLEQLANSALISSMTSEQFLMNLINEKYGKAEISRLKELAKGKEMLKVIVFSGRFIEGKGVLPLLKAFENIQKKHPNTVLLLGGDGPQLNDIKQNMPQNTYLVGMLSYEQNLAMLKAAYIFCLPTISEGFATTVLEAAALKTLVITTSTGGSPELLINENHGTIMPDNNADTIAKAINFALENEVWAEKARNNAYNRLCNHFTWRSVCEKLLIISEKTKK